MWELNAIKSNLNELDEDIETEDIDISKTEDIDNTETEDIDVS